MPFCIKCGIHFNGRGGHCSLHSPYLQDAYDYYTSDYRADTTPIRYRTGRFRSSLPPNSGDRRQRYQTEYHDSYFVPSSIYNPRTPFRSRFSVPKADQAQGLPTLPGNHLGPLLKTFHHLTDTNSIASLTYTVSPAGDLSLTAHANLTREQCLVCLQHFPDRPHLDTHNWEFPVGCEKHGICLRPEDVEFHAMNENHSRCFVTNCGTRYRKEGGWRGSVVERHVREWHAYM
jgi:hypothetical protein